MTGDWRGLLDDIAASVGPTPSGEPLSVTVSCRTAKGRGWSRRHKVLIHPDWTVETPHDLASERVAVAMGGYLSCIALVDELIPATRDWVRGMCRADIPAIGFVGARSSWHPMRRESCCDDAGYPIPQSAAEHVRSHTHVARARGLDPRQLNPLTTAVHRAHAGHGVLAIDPAHASLGASTCVNGLADVVALWEAGVHPLIVAEIHREMVSPRPQPSRFYLGVVTRRPDLKWVADTTASRPIAAESINEPEESMETWLAWSEGDWDLADPTARRRWLETGLTRPMVLVMGAAGYDPDAFLEYAQAVRRHPDNVARTVSHWLRAGFEPDLRDLHQLARAGVSSHFVPSAPAVARLRAEAGVLARGRSDTDLAVLLGFAGTVPDALVSLRARQVAS